MQRQVLIALVLGITLIAGLWLLRPTTPDLANDDGDAGTTSTLAPRRDDRAGPRRAPRSDGGSAENDGDSRFENRPSIAAASQRARQQNLDRDPEPLAAESDPGAALNAAKLGAVPAGGAARPNAELGRAEAAAQERANRAPAPAVAAGAAAETNAPGGPAVAFEFNKSTTSEGGTAPIVEQGVTVSDVGARFAADAQFAVPPPDDFTAQAGTVAFWILPSWIGETDTNASFFQWRTNTFENRIQIDKNGPYLRFIFCDNTGVESGGGAPITEWKEGDWHHVAATWGDGVTALYIDAVNITHKEYNGEMHIPPGTPWMLASDYANGAGGARSVMRSFQVLPRALAQDELVTMVASTRPQ